MKLFIQRDDSYLDVCKDDAEIVELGVGGGDCPEYNHTFFLRKPDVFDLIKKLVEMYGCMDEE